MNDVFLKFAEDTRSCTWNRAQTGGCISFWDCWLLSCFWGVRFLVAGRVCSFWTPSHLVRVESNCSIDLFDLTEWLRRSFGIADAHAFWDVFRPLRFSTTWPLCDRAVVVVTVFSVVVVDARFKLRNIATQPWRWHVLLLFSWFFFVIFCTQLCNDLFVLRSPMLFGRHLVL